VHLECVSEISEARLEAQLRDAICLKLLTPPAHKAFLELNESPLTLQGGTGLVVYRLVSFYLDQIGQDVKLIGLLQLELRMLQLCP
jgi:hypothetical protein